MDYIIRKRSRASLLDVNVRRGEGGGMSDNFFGGSYNENGR